MTRVQNTSRRNSRQSKLATIREKSQGQFVITRETTEKGTRTMVLAEGLAAIAAAVTLIGLVIVIIL
jgi:hypothetical protein